MRELYINARDGAAGDMLSAALLELCPDREDMLRQLNSLGIPGVVYSAERKECYSIMGTHMTVSCDGEEEGEEQEHHHRHRHIGDINTIVDSLNMSDKVKNDVKAVYGIIASAEAAVHGCEVENIHFHELGTLDAVADISAVCYMIDALNIEHISASAVCTGYGKVRCAHGILPVPAPATAKILRDMPAFEGTVEGERCTPTGAALIKYFAESYAGMPDMTVKSAGYGIGKKDFGVFNAVCVTLGDSEETAIELRCNVDDMSPEDIGFAIDALLKAGAPDAYYIPVGMKKNRPGVILGCICRENQRDEMVKLIFRHTTTIGIREEVCRRYVLRRRGEVRETPFGNIRMKISEGYGVEKVKAEYDDLARIASDGNLSLEEVRKLI